MKKYVVYCHINRLNGKRYVGITSQKPEKRWQNGNGYVGNVRFMNAIRKYGWEEFNHEILFTGLTKEEAEEKEIELIAKWNLTNREFGYNKAPGGLLLPELSKESRVKISNSLKETFKKQGHPCCGRKMSEKCFNIMSDANNKRKLKIMQFTLDGVFVKEFESMHEMERQTGFHRAAVKSNIEGKSTQSYGYVWKFKEGDNE